MKFSEWLRKWNLESLKINANVLGAELTWKDADRAAAWDLYVELVTRISTQWLEPEHGDEKTALASLHALFGITREVLKSHGPEAVQFTKIAVPVLNQVVRPFTAKWHREFLKGAFKNEDRCAEFRLELLGLQKALKNYAHTLADIAGVEDISESEAM